MALDRRQLDIPAYKSSRITEYSVLPNLLKRLATNSVDPNHPKKFCLSPSSNSTSLTLFVVALLLRLHPQTLAVVRAGYSLRNPSEYDGLGAQ